MNIKAKSVMIFKHGQEGKHWYTASLSKRLPSGEYERAFIKVRFRNDEIEYVKDRMLIDINDAWISFYKIHDGKTTVYEVFINDFEESEAPKKGSGKGKQTK